MPSTITPEAFDALIAQTGLTLTEAQKATLLEVYPTLRAMIACVTALLPRECRACVDLHAGGAVMSEFITIAQASRQLAAKKLSPVELTKTCLSRIAKLDGTLHAFLLLTEDRALADASKAEARIMAGRPKSPLDGIPIAHKDIYNTAGIRTTDIQSCWNITFPSRTRSRSRNSRCRHGNDGQAGDP